MNAKPRGRQFFNNPGPTNIPDRVLRAMDRPVIDFMSDEFMAIHHACHNGVNKPLYGVSLAKDYPELSVPNP